MEGKPSRQAQERAADATESTRPSPELGNEAPLEARSTLIEKAAQFLNQEDIKQAADSHKIDFLKGKGLTNEEIEGLLQGKSMDALAGAQTQSTPVQQSNQLSTEESSSQRDSSSKLQDAPPIITYPEFLLRPQRPPPLITTDRLLKALYLASGTAAAMYGLNEYVLQPMSESMTTARHSLYGTAMSNIEDLNEKLKAVVSKIPDDVGNDRALDELDIDSVSSDAAHYFSHTKATQTTPQLSRSGSSSSLTKNGVEPPSQVHASNLSKLQSLLEEVTPGSDDPSEEVANSIDGLTEYFKALPLWGKTGQTGPTPLAGAGNEPDGVTQVKNEIKSIKGALLSARNFPGAVTVR